MSAALGPGTRSSDGRFNLLSEWSPAEISSASRPDVNSKAGTNKWKNLYEKKKKTRNENKNQVGRGACEVGVRVEEGIRLPDRPRRLSGRRATGLAPGSRASPADGKKLNLFISPSNPRPGLVMIFFRPHRLFATRSKAFRF